MQLEHAIVALWIISSMLACWAFSVAIRLLADRGARRRKRLATKYTRKSLQLAWLLIVLCVVGAASSAYFADMITRVSGMNTVGVGSLGLTAIGVIFFGCCLAVWGWAGDRPGDQERCPRCWYDMRGSVGLQCPECGHEADEKADLLRTRRPRWAFVLAGVFVVLGSGTLVFKDRLNIRSFQSITPTGFMVSQWDQLPESWLYDTRPRRVGSGDTLLERINDGRVTDAQMQSLAQDVIESMIRSQENRWDPKHISLLQTVMYRSVYPNRGTAPAGPIGPLVTEDQLLRLYTLSGGDIADMLAAGPVHDQTSTRILEANSRAYNTPVVVTQIWLTHTWTGSQPTGRWYLGQRWLHESLEVAKQFQDALSPVLPKFESIDEQTIYATGEDASVADALTVLLWQCGLIDDRINLYLRWASEAPEAYSLSLFKAIGLGIALQESQTRSESIERLGAWVERDDPAQRQAAIYTIAALGEVIKLQPNAHDEGYQRLIATAADACRDDTRLVSYRNREVSVSYLMRYFLVNTDPTGAVIYPLLRDELLGKFPNTTAIDRFYTYQLPYTNELIGNWLSAFEGLADHPDPEVRRWVAAHLPERPSGLYEPSMYEDRIDAVIDTLIESSPNDYEVVEFAERVQRSRSSE